MSIVAEANTAPSTQSWSAWHIDPRHSLAQFSVRHMMLSRVRGQFTGISGKYVKLADTIRGFREIAEGKHDEIPEQAFYMQGSIDDVLEKWEQLKKAG